VTAAANHVARKPLPAVTSVATQERTRNTQLRARFPPRPAEDWWPHTAQPSGEVVQRLASPPFVAAAPATQAGRRRGVAKLLRWLSSFPGQTWQECWLASGAEDHPGAAWVGQPLGG
jgi:hypothetical protein